MGHGPLRTGDGRPRTEMSPETVATIADTLQALSTTSRLRILLRLRTGPCAVGELCEAIGMEQSAVSHQLRVLRHLGLVSRTRHGRHVTYQLHDGHVASLLDEAVYHVEHLRGGVVGAGTDLAGSGRGAEVAGVPEV